jgi:hypothetical protein
LSLPELRDLLTPLPLVRLATVAPQVIRKNSKTRRGFSQIGRLVGRFLLLLRKRIAVGNGFPQTAATHLDRSAA